MLHRDHWCFDFFPFPRDVDVEVSTIWALTDFTEANGATRVAVGAHTLPDAEVHTLVAAGLALKDITANWLSGVLLVATRPFRRGDYIVCSVPSVGRVEGLVEGIDTRLVYLRLEDGKRVLVPASLIYNNPITVTEGSRVGGGSAGGGARC